MGERIAQVNPSSGGSQLAPAVLMVFFLLSWLLLYPLALLKTQMPQTLLKENYFSRVFPLSFQMPLSQSPLLQGCFAYPSAILDSGLYCGALLSLIPHLPFPAHPVPGLRSSFLSPSPLTLIPFLEVSGLVEALVSPPFWSSLRCLCEGGVRQGLVWRVWRVIR